MASASDIELVRINTVEQTDDVFSDSYIGQLIDENGVTGATAMIWESKAARYSTVMDVSEAGASHKFSDLFKNAKDMALLWRGKVTLETVEVTTGRVRVKVIDRQ